MRPRHDMLRSDESTPRPHRRVRLAMRSGTAPAALAGCCLLFAACDAFRTRPVCPNGQVPALHEVAFDGVDNDCDDTVDEVGDTRVHCGGPHLQCVLRPGHADVACVDGECVPTGEAASVEAFDDCFDFEDDDGDGIADNGGHCEVLIANVAHPDCHGRSGEAAECPSTVFTMGEAVPDGGPEHLVELRYDYFVDRFEVTRGQFAAYLTARGQCEGEGADPRCEIGEAPGICADGGMVDDPAKLPASNVSWYEAFDYCHAAGKRLLTEAEWERMARGQQRAASDYPWNPYRSDYSTDSDCGTPPGDRHFRSPETVCLERNLTCDTDFPCGDAIPACENMPITAACRFSSPAPVDQPGGWSLIGGAIAHGAGQSGCRTPVMHVAGNLWEWVLDAYDARGYPLDADGSRRLDPVVWSGCDAERRALRGGSYIELAESATSMRVANRIGYGPGTMSPAWGFRCGRTFGPHDEGFADRVPYDVDALAAELAACERAAPEGGGPIGDTVLISADVCVPDLAQADEAVGAAVNGMISLGLGSAARSGEQGDRALTLALDTASGLLQVGEARIATASTAEGGERAASDARERELVWSGPQPVALIQGACDGWPCEIGDLGGEARFGIDVDGTGWLALAITSVEPLPPDAQICAARPNGDAWPVRIGVHLIVDASTFMLSGTRDISDVICGGAESLRDQCMAGLPEGCNPLTETECCNTCDAWGLTLEGWFVPWKAAR